MKLKWPFNLAHLLDAGAVRREPHFRSRRITEQDRRRVVDGLVAFPEPCEDVKIRPEMLESPVAAPYVPFSGARRVENGQKWPILLGFEDSGAGNGKKSPKNAENRENDDQDGQESSESDRN